MDSKSVAVNKSLQERKSFGPIPADQLLPLSFITAAVVLLYTFLEWNETTTFFVWLWAVSAYLLWARPDPQRKLAILKYRPLSRTRIISPPRPFLSTTKVSDDDH
jgi:type IV secretory pathway TrbD component